MDIEGTRWPLHMNDKGCVRLDTEYHVEDQRWAWMRYWWLVSERKDEARPSLNQDVASANPQIPNLITLVLTDNAIASLSTLLPLEGLVHLRHLCLRGNPVTEHPNYRDFVIWKVRLVPWVTKGGRSHYFEGFRPWRWHLLCVGGGLLW